MPSMDITRYTPLGRRNRSNSNLFGCVSWFLLVSHRFFCRVCLFVQIVNIVADAVPLIRSELMGHHSIKIPRDHLIIQIPVVGVQRLSTTQIEILHFNQAQIGNVRGRCGKMHHELSSGTSQNGVLTETLTSLPRKLFMSILELSTHLHQGSENGMIRLPINSVSSSRISPGTHLGTDDAIDSEIILSTGAASGLSLCFLARYFPRETICCSPC